MKAYHVIIMLALECCRTLLVLQTNIVSHLGGELEAQLGNTSWNASTSLLLHTKTGMALPLTVTVIT